MKISRVIYSSACIFLMLLSVDGFSQASPRSLSNIAEYNAIISTDKVLLVYEPSVPVETILSIIKNTESLHPLQPSRPLTHGRFLARLNANSTWMDVANELKSRPEIISVTPWLRDLAGNERGILPELYIKPRSLGAVGLLQEMVKQYAGTWKGERTDMPGIFEAAFDKNAMFNAWEMALFLNQLPQVEYADINFAFFPKVHTDDSLFNRQWALKNTGGALQWNGTVGADMDMENAWAISTGDSTISIAIMDSGVDTLHPDLRPNLLPGFDATGHNSHGYPNTNFASDGHGTACAGIVAAKGNNQIGVAGVAYNCKIIPVKVFFYIDTTVIFPGIIDTTLYEIPYSETAYMLSGINWAWQTGQADILSNSWGIPAALMPFAPIQQNVISAAILSASQQGRTGKGAIPMFSSGNDNGEIIWPSGSPGTISVGATTNKDKRASFSNYGLGLDITAPGVEITTTDMLGNNGYVAGDYTLDFGGTSAACPNAAGVAALILSIKPEFTFTQVRSLLRVSAERVGGYAYDSTTTDGTWSTQLGYGRVNAFQALSYAPYLKIEESADKTVSVIAYPNPATTVLQVMVKGFSPGTLNYQMLDIAGKTVMSANFKGANDDQIYAIQVDNLVAGVYCLRLFNGEQAVNLKFVKN